MIQTGLHDMRFAHHLRMLRTVIAASVVLVIAADTAFVSRQPHRVGLQPNNEAILRNRADIARAGTELARLDDRLGIYRDIDSGYTTILDPSALLSPKRIALQREIVSLLRERVRLHAESAAGPAGGGLPKAITQS